MDNRYQLKGRYDKLIDIDIDDIDITYIDIDIDMDDIDIDIDMYHILEGWYWGFRFVPRH